MTSNFDLDYLTRLFKDTGYEITEHSNIHFIICKKEICSLAQIHRTSANNYEISFAFPAVFATYTRKNFNDSIQLLKDILIFY